MLKFTRARLSVCLLTVVVAGFATLGHVASSAGPNTISLVSVNASSTGPGNFESRKTAISADGRFIAFTSSASNLTSDIDANDQPDVFLRDRSTNTTTLISRKLNSNTTGNESSGLLDIASTIGISADGRYIVYASRANDLIPSDNNGLADVFVYDRISAVNRLVSFKNADHSLPANGSSGSPVISANGQIVVFLSTASDLSITTDTNSLQDVYACYFNAGVIELVSINNAGAISGNGRSSQITADSISNDGRFVTFGSEASDLVGNDSNGGGAFGTDVFVRDLQNNTTTLASVNAAGTGSGNLSSSGLDARISGDGRFVVFDSRATNLVTGITDINGSFPDIFRRDLVAGTTQVVTVNVAGNSTGSDLSQFPAVSDDGRFVAFSSRSANLVPIDTNNGLGGGVTDVFVRDMQTGVTKLVSMNSAGTDSGNSDSSGVMEISASGRYVLFTSGATNLTTINDFNNNPDLLLRDVSTDTTTHVSVDRFGTAGAASSNNFSMNGSGSVVAFESQSGQIVNNDFNGAIDVFVFTLGSAPTLQFTTTQQSISESTASIQLTVTRSGDTSSRARLISRQSTTTRSCSVVLRLQTTRLLDDVISQRLSAA